MRFRAGQFLNLVFEMGGREVRRAYSLCSDPGRLERVAVTVKPKSEVVEPMPVHAVVRRPPPVPVIASP